MERKDRGSHRPPRACVRRLQERRRHSRGSSSRSGAVLGPRRPRLVRRRRRLARERRASARGSPGSSRARPAPAHACAGRDVRRGRLHARRRALRRGLRTGRSGSASRDVQMLALSGKGRSLIKAGEIDKGLALLDEASASAMCGDLRAHSAGLVYCITISSCQDVGDYRRAAEWTEAANRWCDTLDVRASPARVGSTARRPCGYAATGRRPRRRRVAACEELQDFDQTITGGRPLRDRRDPASPRRLRGRRGGLSRARTRWAAIRSPASRCSGSREGKIDAAAAGITRTLEETDAAALHAFAAFLRRSRSRSRPAISRRPGRPRTRATRSSTRTRSVADARRLRRDRALRAWPDRVRRERDWRGAIASCSVRATTGRTSARRTRRRRRGSLLGIALRRSGDEHAATVELEAALADVRAARRAPSRRRVSRSCSAASTRVAPSSSRTSSTRRSSWRRSVTTSGSACSRATTSSCASGSPTRGGEVDQADGRRLLRVVRESKGRDRRGGRDPARARRRDRRARRPDRRTLGRRVPDRAESTDYGGQGVHVASRIGAAAQAGEILISAETVDGIGVVVPALRAAHGDAQGVRAARRGRLRRLALGASGRHDRVPARRRSRRCERAPRGAARPCARGAGCRVRA